MTRRALHPSQEIPSGGQSGANVRLLTEREAAERCRYFDRGCVHALYAFQRWAKRAGVPVKVVGRRRLYDPRILDAFMDREPWTQRHRNTAPKKVVTRKLNLVRHDASVQETTNGR